MKASGLKLVLLTLGVDGQVPNQSGLE